MSENKAYFSESELILNKDGSVYHLHLLPDDIGNTIITVGDPERVPSVSKYFDKIDRKERQREFVTHTGSIGNQRITVISTGIGTDNIDIVMTELDALVNIDLKNRCPKQQHTALNIIRVGTSGSMQADIPVDSLLVSEYGLGLEGLLLFYEQDNSEEEAAILAAFEDYNKLNNIVFINPYLSKCSEVLKKRIGFDMSAGITATCTGFYAPQGRQLRAKIKNPHILSQLSAFEYGDLHITNFEMETAGIYGMSKILGHHALSLNAILVNRKRGEFSKNADKTINRLVEKVFSRL